MKRVALIITFAMLAASATADDGKPPSSRQRNTGLGVFVNANGYWSSDNTANFYSGRETALGKRDGNIYRILGSNSYGHEIWQDLRTNRLISDAIGSERDITVAEWANMYYRLSYQLGVGIRYDYASGFGWLLRFDLAKLRAQGQWNIDATNGTGQLGYDRYVPCGITGTEDRINIDFAITHSIALTNAVDLELDLGASLINTKVKENEIIVNGHTYSILDRWGGRTPDMGVGSYEYINQGGVGYGFFASLLVGYQVPGIGALKFGYTCAQNRIVLEGYTAWGWHHSLGIRIEINNFF
jgi:hypothetical protein